MLKALRICNTETVPVRHIEAVNSLGSAERIENKNIQEEIIN